MSWLTVLNRDVIACTRCPRLVAYREQVAREKRRAYRDWEYWGKPVPGFGDPYARVLLVILGLNLAGILRIPALERTWRPLDAGAASSLAGATGSVALASPGSAGGPSFGDRLGGRVVNPGGGWLAAG